MDHFNSNDGGTPLVYLYYTSTNVHRYYKVCVSLYDFNYMFI